MFIGERFDEDHEHVGNTHCVTTHRRVINGNEYRFVRVGSSAGTNVFVHKVVLETVKRVNFNGK